MDDKSLCILYILSLVNQLDYNLTSDVRRRFAMDYRESTDIL